MAPNDSGKRGKRDDGAFLLALAAGAPVPAAAEQGKISETTAWRRLRDPAFRREVEAKRAELVANAVGRLSTAGTLAVDELLRLIQAGKSEAVRLGACRALLENMFRGHELNTLGSLVTELQAELAEVRALVQRDGAAAAGADAGGGADPAAGPVDGAGARPYRPDGGDDGGGPEAGPLAAGSLEVPLCEDAAALLAPGG